VYERTINICWLPNERVLDLREWLATAVPKSPRSNDSASATSFVSPPGARASTVGMPPTADIRTTSTTGAPRNNFCKKRVAAMLPSSLFFEAYFTRTYSDVLDLYYSRECYRTALFYARESSCTAVQCGGDLFSRVRPCLRDDKADGVLRHTEEHQEFAIASQRSQAGMVHLQHF
jgi:hypothetical protein